jgi:hypothetical protein
MHKQEEEWGFLLINANNAFNEHNQTGMVLYTDYYKWLLCARLVVSSC